jgi:hypothetical protein
LVVDFSVYVLWGFFCGEALVVLKLIIAYV